MGKIEDSLGYLEEQRIHYRNIRKRYARSRRIVESIALGSGSLSVMLTTSGVAASMSGIGITIGAPLGILGSLLGLVSGGLTVLAKKLTDKVSKNEKALMLVKSKISSTNQLISKSLTDGKIDEKEFDFILKEVENYELLRNELRKSSRLKVVTK